MVRPLTMRWHLPSGRSKGRDLGVLLANQRPLYRDVTQQFSLLFPDHTSFMWPEEISSVWAYSCPCSSEYREEWVLCNEAQSAHFFGRICLVLMIFLFSLQPLPHSLCCLNPGSWIYTPRPWFLKVMRTWTWDPTSSLGALSSLLCFLFTTYFEHLILS